MNFLWVSKKTSKKTSKMKLSVGVQEENLQEENQWVSKKRIMGVQEENKKRSVGVQEETPKKSHLWVSKKRASPQIRTPTLFS